MTCWRRVRCRGAGEEGPAASIAPGPGRRAPRDGDRHGLAGASRSGRSLFGGLGAGAFLRPVAGAVHEDPVAGVDEAVQQGFADDRVGEELVPLLWRPVRGEDHGFAGAFGDEFVEVVGLGGGELAHAPVIQDEHGGAGEFGQALGPGVVGAPTGQVR
jgi:hypothetical protein